MHHGMGQREWKLFESCFSAGLKEHLIHSCFSCLSSVSPPWWFPGFRLSFVLHVLLDSIRIFFLLLPDSSKSTVFQTNFWTFWPSNVILNRSVQTTTSSSKTFLTPDGVWTRRFPVERRTKWKHLKLGESQSSVKRAASLGLKDQQPGKGDEFILLFWRQKSL